MKGYELYTPALKDSLLKILVEGGFLNKEPNPSFDRLAEHLLVDPQLVIAALMEFNDLGLIKLTFNAYPKFSFALTPFALNKVQTGGFTAEHEVLENQLKLLQLQVDKLEGVISVENMTALTTIVANLSSTLFQFFGHK